MTIEMPAERTLLSNFRGWGRVLNRWYLGFTEEDAEAWHERAGSWMYDRVSPIHQQEIRESWERIFGSPNVCDGDDHPIVQAVFEELFLEDVVKVQHFQMR
jgi:hypothetical protein